MASKVTWEGNDLYSELRFGLLSIQAYQDPNDDKSYRYRIGSKLSRGKYTTMNGAQLAGLKKLKRVCQTVLNYADHIIEEHEKIFREAHNEHLARVRPNG